MHLVIQMASVWVYVGVYGGVYVCVYFKVLVNLFKFAISGEVEVGQGQDLVDRRGVIGSLPQKILRAIIAC